MPFPAKPLHGSITPDDVPDDDVPVDDEPEAPEAPDEPEDVPQPS